MEIGDIQLLRNEKKKSLVRINSEIQLPIWTIVGKEKGPTLVTTTGVHGCEYVGILAVRELFNQVDCSALKGQLIILPLMNESGFYQGAKQIVPEDGKNLNRMFPGKEDGTKSEQIAFWIEKYIYPQADFLIDLHGGDINEAMEPLVFFSRVAGEEIERKSREAAACLNVGYRIPSIAKNGLYSYAAQKGVPSLLQEIGGLGQWNEKQVQQCIDGVFNLMKHLKMIKGNTQEFPQKEAVETVYEEAIKNGLWFPRVKAGQTIFKNEVLGNLEDLNGNKIQTITASFNGIVWYHTVSLGVNQGEPLIAYGYTE